MTRHPLRVAALGFALAALQGCGDVRREPEPLHVNAKSGARPDLSRTTWQLCLPAVEPIGQSELSRIVHGEDGVVTYTTQGFDAPGCTGTAGPLTSVGGVGFVEGERAVTWSDAAPAGAPESPLATKVFLDGGVILALDCFWLDDTVAPRVLYAGAPESPTDAQGYPDLLLSTGYAEVP